MANRRAEWALSSVQVSNLTHNGEGRRFGDRVWLVVRQKARTSSMQVRANHCLVLTSIERTVNEVEIEQGDRPIEGQQGIYQVGGSF